MDPRLLQYYNAELVYVREMAQEFAERNPKIAARLDMNGSEASDPYVERLLQGFSFLTAHIQLQLDEQFPQFSQRLLDGLAPNFLAPTPSMTVVKFHPDMKEGTLEKGFTVPRHSLLLANQAKDVNTACQFRTAHDVTLWPLEVLAVNCTPTPTDLPLSPQFKRTVKGAICIRLQAVNGELKQLDLDRLTFHLAGETTIPSRLYELIFTHAVGVVGCESGNAHAWMELLGPKTIFAEGFDNGQALLPYDPCDFQGYRLLQEYFTLPARFHFFTLTALKRMVSKVQGDILDLTILLDSPPGDLERMVDKSHIALFCTPAINLFPKTNSTVAIDPQLREHHVPADKADPLDYEIYSVDAVTGVEENSDKIAKFHPFHTASGSDRHENIAYYAIRRELHQVPTGIPRRSIRTNYIGSTVLVALIDRNREPFKHQCKDIAVNMLCTNGDLPLSLPKGESTDFTLINSGPIQSVSMLCAPTEPKAALAVGATAWHVISHLNMNYLTLSELDEDKGPVALREFLSIYAPLADTTVRKHIDALRYSKLAQVPRILPKELSPLGYGLGIAIHITVDEELFGGTSPYLFGAMLEQLFARHVGQFSFTETILHSLQRGEIARWMPRMGKRSIA